MPATSWRIQRYLILASAPALAVTDGSAVGSVIYQAVDLSLEAGEQVMLGDDLFSMRFANQAIFGGCWTVGADSGLAGSVEVAGSFRFLDNGIFSGSFPFANRFESGSTIDFDAFDVGPGYLIGGGQIGSSASSAADWKNQSGMQTGYLGFSFRDKLDVYYGWVSVDWDGATLTIGGYAYESDAGTSILAGSTKFAPVPGAPTALGLVGLAAGAAGVRRHRGF